MQANTLSPSFSSYSNGKLAEIAARIVEEFDSDEFSGESSVESRENSGEDDEEFEFTTVVKDPELASQTSADEIFRNGEIQPVYPVFSKNLLYRHLKFQNENVEENESHSLVTPKIRLPLRKLFHEERETAITTSSSSSEAEEIDGVIAVSYCVWPPKAADVHRRKSNSADNSSKKWKLRDFLLSSHSDGSKKSFVVLPDSNSGREKENEKKVAETPKESGKVNSAPPPPCTQNGGEKQRLYLPPRRDLAGLFGDFNGFKKNLMSY